MTPVAPSNEVVERSPAVAQEISPVPPLEGAPAARSEAGISLPAGPAAPAPTSAPPTPPNYPSAAYRRPSRGRWAWSIGLVVLGGLAWWIYGFVLSSVGFSLGGGRDVFSILVSTLVAAVPALTCLVAGWLLRSWTGMIVAALVYMAASALMWMLAAVGDLATAEFALYIVMPAVVLGAIGAAIGMAIAGRRS